MGKKRGFLAEMQRAARAAEQEQRRRQVAQQRAFVAAQREAERSRREAERAAQQLARATAAEQAAAEREAKRLYQEARQDEVDVLNAELASKYEELDGLLAATLEVDDYVDLDELHQEVNLPRFEPGTLAYAAPKPAPPQYPLEPVYVAPQAPSGLSAMFGGKKKHEADVALAEYDFQMTHTEWVEQCRQLAAVYQHHVSAWEAAEAKRVRQLAQAERDHERRCREHEEAVAAANAELEELKNNLAFDVPAAIEEYVQIILANSTYPSFFPVMSTASFDLPTRELSVQLSLPDPSEVPTVKEYRYSKALDDITATQWPVKMQKDRYASVVHQVAVRTLHEIFEADRAGKINSVRLTLVVPRISPATGNREEVPLVQVAAARDEFATFDLANVDPRATLEHLGAALSKNPHGLTPANLSAGVRKRASQ